MACRLLALCLLLFPGVVSWGQAPEGYYDDIGTAEGPDLRVALRDIIKDHTRRSYHSLWTYFWDTDRRNGDKVWDIYTHIPPPGSPVYEFLFFEDQQTGGGGQEGDFYNREHSFPTSWWGGGTSASDTMYTDLHHIYPTDCWVNSLRNNWPYGEVTHPSRTTSNGGITPPDGYLVRMSDVGLEAIETPEDGVPVADNGSDKNVPFGRQSVAFGMLSPQTIYYFKLFPYRGSGAQIRYKTDGEVQQISLEAH